ncbi:MAG: hypothetical protein IJ165_13645 [Proteobacteria bacterium]|nr:hypothetical protein [Pseudomonadota bacterium]
MAIISRNARCGQNLDRFVHNKYSAQCEESLMPKNIEDYVCVIGADGIGEPD